MRWHSARLFPWWTRHGRVDASRSPTPGRSRCEVEATRLARLVPPGVCRVSFWTSPDRRLPQAAQTVQTHALHLARACTSGQRLGQALWPGKRCRAAGGGCIGGHSPPIPLNSSCRPQGHDERLSLMCMGAASNPPNRFTPLWHVRDPDWTDPEDPAPSTQFFKDKARAILTLDVSPVWDLRIVLSRIAGVSTAVSIAMLVPPMNISASLLAWISRPRSW